MADRVTSQQSGTFGVMADACRLTREALTRLRDGRRSDAELPVIELMLSEAVGLSQEVESWKTEVPPDEARRSCIARILELRQRVDEFERNTRARR